MVVTTTVEKQILQNFLVPLWSASSHSKPLAATLVISVPTSFAFSIMDSQVFKQGSDSILGRLAWQLTQVGLERQGDQ